MSMLLKYGFVGLLLASGAAFAGECEGEYQDGYARGFLGMETREIGACQAEFNRGFAIGKADIEAAQAVDTIAVQQGHK
jgi:hypothetical protein